MTIDQASSHPLASRARALVVLAGVLALVYFVLPNGTGAEWIRVIAPAIGAGAVLIGIATYQPERTLPWVTLAIALGCLAASNAVAATLYFASRETFPSVADPFRLVAAGLLLATATMLGHDTAATDARSGIETTIVSIAVGVGVWLIVIEPFLGESDVAPTDHVWAASIPLLEAVALAIALHTTVQMRFRYPSAILLAVGLAFQLCSDVARSAQELRDTVGSGGVFDALSIAAPLVLASAALDPTMALTHLPDDEPDTVGFARVVWLSVAALTPLTVLFTLTVTGLGSQETRTALALCSIAVVVLALARVWGLVARVRQLTERQGQDRLAAMVEHSSDVVMLTNASGQIQYASPGLVSTLGHHSDDWNGRPLIDLVSADDRAAAALELQRVVQLGQGSTVKFEVSLVRVDGQRRRMEATIANLLGGDAVDGMVATFRDVTEQRDLERQLSHRAFHDELTGLANRALFLDRMDHALRVARPENDPLVVLFVDLDDFKSVNDALGHGVGDQLLRSIADRIRQVDGNGRHPGPARWRRIRHPPRGQRWGGSGDRRGRTTARPAPRARQPGRIRTGRVGQRRGRRRLARHDHLRSVARCRHRHVRGQTGRQEPDQDLRPRDAPAGHTASRVPHRTEPGDRTRPDAPDVPADDRSRHRRRRRARRPSSDGTIRCAA